MRNKIRGIQGFHHGPSKDDPKSLNQQKVWTWLQKIKFGIKLNQ